MTAEGSTGAPLRQQIAEAIHKGFCDCSSYPEYCREGWPAIEQFQDAADAVVALLNLTEEHGVDYEHSGVRGPARDAEEADEWVRKWRAVNTSEVQRLHRLVTPWLPSTPPDTSSSEPA